MSVQTRVGFWYVVVSFFLFNCTAAAIETQDGPESEGAGVAATREQQVKVRMIGR